MELTDTVQDLIDDVEHASPQTNPSYFIKLFEDAFKPLPAAPEPVQRFHKTYLDKDTPSTSLNKTGMLQYLPELQTELQTRAYMN